MQLFSFQPIFLRPSFAVLVGSVAMGVAGQACDFSTASPGAGGAGGSSTSTSSNGGTGPASSTGGGMAGTSVTGMGGTAGTAATGAGGSATTGSGGGGAGGSSAGDGGAGGDPSTTGGGMAGTTVDMCKPTTPAVTIPFAVDTVFPDTALMGLTPADISGVLMETTCPTRAPIPVGSCHKITYTPAPANAGVPWAGAYWLPGVQNWGVSAGKNIAPGAAQLTLYAAGAHGGEVVKFVVGGVTGNSGLACADTISASVSFTLTTTMTKYSVPMNTTMYGGVWGGFAWTAEAAPGPGGAPGDAGADGAAAYPPVVFYVDSIQWE